MNRSKSAFGIIAGSMLFMTSTTASAVNLDKVNSWISTSNRSWLPCNHATPVSVGPFFQFNDPLAAAPVGVCRETGPFPVQTNLGGIPVTHDWWVQVISNLNIPSTSKVKCTGTLTCFRDIIRVCSTFYAAHRPSVYTAGPCETGIGNAGCEVCSTADHGGVTN
jgi:hypothetical protein